ncbi:MAG: metallophosphoesterase [Candidatus Aramenus sulfurataquae]|jgi:Icc-related predicted phosphoesterase|uniref:Metallophosphoesterase family protein n=3 Tax=Candidatus Aramenus sulfurataquae TaxID=1326980 RepID=A0AAE3FN48_9CREN|nr:metallophosphoesterase family protein [Candidatus Aramenus sulfurataquae]
MLIGAISDIHSPKYLNDFFVALRYLPKVDLVLLAGDLTERGNYLHFDPVYNALKKFKVVATFGNEDFVEYREKFREKYPEVIWLEDQKVELGGISVVGSEGVIEKPTFYQRLKGLDESFYMKRKEKIEELLCSSSGFKILLTHYATTFATVYGEKKFAYPGLGYNLLEEVKCLPNISVHGHAHYAKVTYAVVRGVKVYNVALPANRKFTVIRIDETEVDGEEKPKTK